MNPEKRTAAAFDAQGTATVLRPYGVGIDTHSQFIQVCVLRQAEGVVHRYEAEFKTDWGSLRAAQEWTLGKLDALVPEAALLRYCIESTGTYHFPVMLAFGGAPSVVNPMLAGPTRRKTDVLDARLLAHHSITGMWPESFLPDRQSQELRVLWAQRGEAQMAATRAGTASTILFCASGTQLGLTTQSGH